MDYIIINGALDYKGDKAALTGNVVIPEGVTDISMFAFSNCTGIVSVQLPSTLMSIGNYAFENCTSLESVQLPSALMFIGDLAFKNCSSLKSVFVPQGVQKIGQDAFKYSGLQEICVHEDNIHFCSVDGVLYTKNMQELLIYPEKKSSLDYVIPDGVVKIHDAFRRCSYLRCLTCPNGAEFVDYADLSNSIDEVRLIGCNSLANIPLIVCCVTNVIAPEADINQPNFYLFKQRLVCGYAKAWLNGWTTGSKNNIKFEKYICWHYRMLYDVALSDIWLMRYMTVKRLIPQEDIGALMERICDNDLNMRALLLEYSSTFNNKDFTEELIL